MSSGAWTVYILRCADDTLYTGITNNLAQRLEKHDAGTGAKYTKGRGPFALVFSETHATKSDVLKREIQIKKLSREDKLKLAGL